MSGVRVHSPELRALGVTLPGFVERGNVIASMPSLSLLTLAAHTSEDWLVSYSEYDETIPKVEHDLVAISTLTARANDAFALADALRAEGRKVVIGGLHASALPNECASHADAVVVGEGESVWKELLADWPNLRPIYRSVPSAGFDWRIPRYDLLDVNLYNRIPLQTTRGCPLDCAFCGASRLISPYKRKDLAAVRAELESISGLWSKPFIELADDNTFVNKRWSKELVKLLGEFPIRWFTETDVTVADDDELLELLAGSGCAQLLIGFESVAENSLLETDSGSFKLRRRDKYLEAIAKIQSYGISVNGCFIHGFDHDTPDVFDATLSFARESGLSEVQATVLTPFPGTALYARLKREQRLLHERFWDQCTPFDVTFRPAKMSVADLETGFRGLLTELYNPAETARRRSIMHGDYRRARRNEASADPPR